MCKRGRMPRDYKIRMGGETISSIVLITLLIIGMV